MEVATSVTPHSRQHPACPPSSMHGAPYVPSGDESGHQSHDDDRMEAAELLMQFGSKPGDASLKRATPAATNTRPPTVSTGSVSYPFLTILLHLHHVPRGMHTRRDVLALAFDLARCMRRDVARVTAGQV